MLVFTWLESLKRPRTMASGTAATAGYFNILYFASASSHTTKDSERLAAPLPLSQLFPLLESRYPGFRGRILDSCLVTINLEYVDVPSDDGEASQIVIREGDEVAIIPPVSSG